MCARQADSELGLEWGEKSETLSNKIRQKWKPYGQDGGEGPNIRNI